MPCVSLQGLTPYEFVESMKKKGIRVPGIGHRYIFSTILNDRFNSFDVSYVICLVLHILPQFK